jgi:hypothetical protein
MSMTGGGVDARKYLARWAGALADMTCKDIRAIPADKWKATFGGSSKSACDSTADAVSLLFWTVEALKGNVVQTDEPDARNRILESCSSQESACVALSHAAKAFGEALTAASDEALNTIVTPPWKMDAPLFMLAQIAASHIWYHDGQLNYIQLLLGDERVHWTEP